MDTLTQALPGVADRLSDTLASLSFGNAVGVFDVPGVGRLEVVSGKWDARHYDRMLGQLTEIAVNLPFASGDGAGLPYDRSIASHEDVLYHAFVYLRYVVLGSPPVEQALLPALGLVLRDPHRHLQRIGRQVRPERVRRLAGRAMEQVLSGSPLAAVPSVITARVPLARALRGHLPDSMEEVVAIHTPDTPENRFVKSFLSLAEGVITGMRRAARKRDSAFTRRILSECDDMDRQLEPILRHSLWKEVGNMVHVPAGSMVLQRKRGYREIFSHWSRLNLATKIPISPDRVRDLLEVKDIAELYELWSFFLLLRTLEGLLGRPQKASRPRVDDLHVTVPWEMEVRWACGVRVHYNPSFRASHSGTRQSYSVGLRPDISLEIRRQGKVELHLFDAKFRVDALQAGLAEGSVEDDHDIAAAERKGSFKRGDTYKMHTYRDAITAARSVWILYPGTEFRFFSPAGIVTNPAACAVPMDGVGAVPCLPDGRPDELAALIERMLVGGLGSSIETASMGGLG